MNLFNNLRIGSRLALCFGTLLLLILGLSAFSLLRLQAVSETMREENRIRSEKLEPLYVAREALDQEVPEAERVLVDGAVVPEPGYSGCRSAA